MSEYNCKHGEAHGEYCAYCEIDILRRELEMAMSSHKAFRKSEATLKERVGELEKDIERRKYHAKITKENYTDRFRGELEILKDTCICGATTALEGKVKDE